ncbi:phospholipase C [Conexibacter sp. DBS9H8]|uniref:phospholipase C n=1 Tax=Conexibacter sp. DBS9H8 TaxID=2937801 RepID=UPI00200DBFE8|nr:alkaline phosphatase family protein [Conexibacter sp. DBS9H8]
MNFELPDAMRGRPVNRRELLNHLGVLGAAAFLARPAAAWGASGAPARLVRQAASVRPYGSDLEAVEHIVFLMMENRSYDHYFGSYEQGRGFDDHPRDALGVFAQAYPNAPAGLFPADTLLPFHLNSSDGFECTDDLTHDWGPMHLCWNGGKMDSWVKVHTSSAYEGPRGAMTMGYYTRADLPFYYALADHFTLLDAYHASILGPTHPNRIMANTGTIDPAGGQGGPITDTNFTPDVVWNCTWPTMQEVLEDAGVSWKVYNPSNSGLAGTKYAGLSQFPTWDPALYDPIANPEVMTATDQILPYFTAFRNRLSPLYAKAFGQFFPSDFVADVSAGTLPSVSWIIPPLGFDEHPSSSPDNGMWFTSLVLDALVANPAVWSKTAVFLMYDENDGWFDHVAPPTAPPGTPGEYLTATAPKVGDPDPGTLGITGPLGLGVRVPGLMISPFSRGGRVATELFDHTSQLKLIAARFGVEVPNVSAWRSELVGDLTSTMFHSRTDETWPAGLPATAPYVPSSGVCKATNQDTESGGATPSIPTDQTMPTQGGGEVPASRYFPTHEKHRIPPGHRTPMGGTGKPTRKSAHNALAER